MHDMDSTPPAIMQSAMPARIFAEAMAMVSRPEEQYLFTVIPGTFSVFRLSREIILPRFNPCSASGVSFPTMTSSRSEEHTSELQSLIRISYAVFCLKKKTHTQTYTY